ncbi:uL30 family ribosomal protein [Candidatus Woesearchaeota archaeon]|nr:uL30 family ribosomal protein [Candidatus Woesearchaeota archaeon]
MSEAEEAPKQAPKEESSLKNSTESKLKEKSDSIEKKAAEKLAKIAVIVVRGITINLKTDIKDTLNIMNLFNKYNCIVVENKPDVMGMIKKAKDFITWGEISAETEKTLFEKRGEEFNGREQDSKGKIVYNKFIEYNKKKYKRTFRLNPPKGGWERKGTKKPLTKGGSLGYRGDKINDLLQRMM